MNDAHFVQHLVARVASVRHRTLAKQAVLQVRVHFRLGDDASGVRRAALAPRIKAHGLQDAALCIEDQVDAAQVVFEEVLFFPLGFCTGAIEGLGDLQIPQVALPFQGTVRVFDFFYRTQVEGFGHPVITGVGVFAVVARAIRAVFEVNGVGTFGDFGDFVEGAVGECAPVALGVVAIGVVGVGGAARSSDRMGAGVAAVGVVAYVRFVGDVAQSVVVEGLGGATLYLAALESVEGVVAEGL